jgi:hypothetical protein
LISFDKKIKITQHWFIPCLGGGGKDEEEEEHKEEGKKFLHLE